MEYDRWLWGKKEPFCSLSGHMIAVGACSMEYLLAPSTYGLLSQISVWLNMNADETVHLFSYIAALHDIGKAHPSFQQSPDDSDSQWRIQNYRHEQVGAEILKALWRDYGWTRRESGFFGAVVYLHHQGKRSCSTNRRVPETWATIHRDLEQRMRDLFRPPHELPALQNLNALGAVLTAVLILCDWVASSSEFGAEMVPCDDDREALLWMREHARVHLSAFGLISGVRQAYPRERFFTALWRQFSPEAMRPLQNACQAIGETPAALTIIEAPMGEGKTETALYLAGRLCEHYGKRGIYMALPTAATSNQMVGRVRDMLDSHQAGDVRLLHSMAWIVDDLSASERRFVTEDAQNAEDWLRPLRRGLLSENAVGTVDQAMAAVLRVKYGFLRLLGLAQKVLIIDEIHAYDIYMSTIIAGLLDWCRAMNTPVIMLSATLQDRQKQIYLSRYDAKDGRLNTAYPLVTQVMMDGKTVQTPVAGVHMGGMFRFNPVRIGSDVGQTADLVQQRARNGGCICAMMNTVRQAQALYRELKARGETEIMLFHARFTAKRRAEIEQRCLELFGRSGARPCRMILVCTQVVEQSLDVDFDAMITQLAPMDLLLQRAGRVHRHAGNPRPKGLEWPVIEVILPDMGAAAEIGRRYGLLGGVYPEKAMKNTEDMLDAPLQVSVPEDIRACVERAYRDIEAIDPAELIRWQLDDQLKIGSAEGVMLPVPNPDDFFARTPSVASTLSLTDDDDGFFLRGAKTRDGYDSQRFAFLPDGFPEFTLDKAWIKKAMEYSCGIRLRRSVRHEIGDEKKAEKDSCVKVKGCIMLRADELGLFRWHGRFFACSDEFGIEEMDT